MIRKHSMPHGAEVRGDGEVRFRIWAPACHALSVEINNRLLPMNSCSDGWHELRLAEDAGAHYRYVLPNGQRVPDPASRFQPQDVHGPSELIDPSVWDWSDAGWKGRPWEEAVIYELHVGAFTPAGNFRGVMSKLDYLQSLGVTAIELMPIGDFPGSRNWGYDGALIYAPDAQYGRPEDLKGLVETAHARGMMVLLDVIYNHFGPEGNYLPAYAPQFFSATHRTPWGAAINYDGECSGSVRDFVIHNALYWLEEFHLDGLRLDAVHAIVDDSPVHLLDELARRVRQSIADRHVHLILENDRNQADRLIRDPDGHPLTYTAQWNDDVHHVLHTAVTGESETYYAGYVGNPETLGKALAEGFVRARGNSGAHLPPTAFISFIQNHDQIGNRAIGDRLGATVPTEALRAAAAVYLLMPEIPMLFMGEEWNAAQPFPFFSDLGSDLAEAVRRGRREEFPHHRGAIPDPQAVTTFASAVLRWEGHSIPQHSGWLEWYRRILRVRSDYVTPELASMPSPAGSFEVVSDGAVMVRWRLKAGELSLAANLSSSAVCGFPASNGETFWQEGKPGEDGCFAPWSVRWTK